ncbi:hypothetical protein C8R46DRAFT_1148894 [Mycena filopes]|nr:hypothetical protein C8R46DRAFT_1148894 [Mycena filopes]
MSDDSYSRSPSPEPEMMQQSQPSAGRERGRPPQQSQQPPQAQQSQALTQQAPQGKEALGGLLHGVTGGGQQQGKGGKDTLKLRLDLNLDVDVQIKARVHGDVTLSLL